MTFYDIAPFTIIFGWIGILLYAIIAMNITERNELKRKKRQSH